MISSWQQRRSRLNHDELQNKYCNHLRAFINRFNLSHPDVSRLSRFLEEDFKKWEKYREEVKSLLNSFEDDMSPKVLFRYSPLNHCDHDTKEWLGNLVHELWLRRHPVSDWIAEASNALKKADFLFLKISTELNSKSKPEFRDNELLRILTALREEFVCFKDACIKLSHALSMFPSAILVV